MFKILSALEEGKDGMVDLLDNYLFDGIDGIVARATKTTSNVGFILDHTFDFVLRRIWYFALAYAGFISYDIVALAIFSLLRFQESPKKKCRLFQQLSLM